MSRGREPPGIERTRPGRSPHPSSHRPPLSFGAPKRRERAPPRSHLRHGRVRTPRAARRPAPGLAEENRPLGAFLFLGRTGVGNTRLVRALAGRLFATEESLVRIDTSVYREPHTIAWLIGAAPGYVGCREGGRVTDPVRRRRYSMVLLNEIEKAHLVVCGTGCCR